MNLFKIILYNLTTPVYGDIDLALENPHKIKRLIIRSYDNLLKGNLNNYASDFLKFVNLQELRIQLGPNDLPTLPTEIGELKTLKKLSILNVPFNDFPEWATNLVNLEYLMVRGCEITSVPKIIANLKKLEILRIENCKLAEMPEGINELTLLKELSFSDTPILFSSIKNLPKSLKTLSLVMNENLNNYKSDWDRVYHLFPNIEISPDIKQAEGKKQLLEELNYFIQP